MPLHSVGRPRQKTHFQTGIPLTSTPSKPNSALMKFSIKNLAFVAMAAMAVTLASCTDDAVDPIMTPNRAPEVSLRNADGTDFDGMISIPANSSAQITLSATDADGNLKTVEFQRNGTRIVATSGFVRIDEDRNASTPLTNIAANPLLIVDNKSAYNQTFTFSGSTEFATQTTYSIIVTDEAGLATSQALTITTENMPVRRDSVIVLTGKFFNRDGTEFGSLDLVTGDSISSTNTTSKSRLQDAGNIANSNPLAWTKQIIAEGDARIVTFKAEDLTAFNFDNITFMDQIRELVNNGTTPTDPTATTRTRTLKEGDSFLVKTTDRVYVVRISKLVETNNNNLDYYEVTYKYGASM